MSASILALVFALSLSAPSPDDASLRLVRDGLHRRVVSWLDRDRFARRDGYVYAVDVGHLLVYAARLGDRALFDRLRGLALEHFVQDDPQQAFTRGFVAWRRLRGTPPDASGTTEALRIARGLWEGAGRFGRAEDRERVRRILHGYARHAYVDQGVWHIRNYYNFGTKAFTNDSFLVDYDPDLLEAVERALHDEALLDVARRSYALVRRARAPSGLSYDMIQPDVRTLYPNLDLVAFSPNDLVQLNNSCTVAETVVQGDRPRAEEVLAFARARAGALTTHYYGRTGEPVYAPATDTTTLSCLARLAATLGDAELARALAGQALPGWQALAAHDDAAWLYVATEALLALQAMLGR